MAKQNKFGTFGGVFVPSILTILGVIMYLRLPMIVGQAGLWATLGIILVAHIISITTGLSVSSIATDKKVEAGGTYFIISRSLGLPIGGTLGLALFVGLSFSVSLYLIGFSESFLNYWGLSNDINNIRITGTIVLLAVTTLTFISTSLAVKTQYFIMATIFLSLLSVFFGKHELSPEASILPHPSSAIPLMVLFGIFFPAVTGFEAGVSMSGDLKDPKKSIPMGSIMAITVGFLVYIGLTFFFAKTVDANTLANDPNVLFKISWIPQLVIAGVWGATLSSALGSILGAPRILQATANDKITPRWLGVGFGPTNEPRNALLLTFVIAELGILIGELDIIARIVSIFFITTYGFLNISAAFEKWTGADFRPEFKISGWISLLGAVACMVVMIQLDFIAMMGATVIMVLLFLFLKRKELQLESGDAWSGVWASLVRSGLTKLKRSGIHQRNWRPNIIMFLGGETSRTYLLDIGRAISGKLGILSVFDLQPSDDESAKRMESNLVGEDLEVGYFQHKLLCSDVYEGMEQVARMYGFSGVEPNTVLMGWSNSPKHKPQFIDLMGKIQQYGYSGIYLDYDEVRKFGQHHTIDIWWSGVGNNLTLAINLIHHLTSSNLWKRASVRLLVINPYNSEAETIYKSTENILNNYREEAEIRIINNEFNPLPESEIIGEESKEADLIIIGLPNHRYQQLSAFYDDISSILGKIGSTLIINAATNFETWDVISDLQSAQSGKAISAFNTTLALPPVPQSKYPEINSDILKIDTNGQKVLELFYKKYFAPAYNLQLEVLNQISDWLSYINKEIKQIGEFPDWYRISKGIDKLKNDVLYKTMSFYGQELKEESVNQLTETQSEGLDWYINRLSKDIKRYPKILKVSYSSEDFVVLSNDSFGIKTFKKWKKLTHLLTKRPITQAVELRKVAEYYQQKNRLVFIKRLLLRFQQEDIAFYGTVRKLTNSIIAFLNDCEQNTWQEKENWIDYQQLKEIQQTLDLLLNKEKESATQFQSRLKAEFRKNLTLMTTDLERIDVNATIKRKTRANKYYKTLAEEITALPEAHLFNVQTLLNKLQMELSVNSIKNRIEALHDGFNEQLHYIVNHRYLKQLDGLTEKLTDATQPVEELEKVKVGENFETSLEEALSTATERMTALVETLPEEQQIYATAEIQDNQPTETLSIPLAAMASYYLKSRYEVVVNEHFEHLIEFLKKSVFSIREMLVLTQFNIENKPEATAHDREEAQKECIAAIKAEKLKVEEEINHYIENADAQLAKAFEPLTSTNIEQSAREFVTGLRTYKSEKVMSGISQMSARARAFWRRTLTKILYGRSSGILLARKLQQTHQIKSLTSRILDLKEKLSPYADVLDALPPFYITLFNGKSSIGKDFWITRPLEEQLMAKAYNRYKAGYHGGILVLGERNSGKTSFCKHVTQNLDRHARVISVFPPLQGSAKATNFNVALSRAAQMEGDISHIMQYLPKGSVVIINDLELFWERNATGMEVVDMVQSLIDEYGHKILFIINMNPHAFRLINQLRSLDKHFIEIINFSPLNAENIRELIMTRHRSSALGFNLEGHSGPLNELHIANLFNSHFDFSDGNAGTALNAWLTCIQTVKNGELTIRKPVVPSLSALHDLDSDWTMLLTQLILHKRLSLERMYSVVDWDKEKCEEILQAMMRSGLITERTTGIYTPDPYIHPFLIKALKEKGVLL